MNKHIPGLLFAMAMSMSVQAQTSGSGSFLETLNRCVAMPRASLVECARMTGSMVGTGWISVTQGFAISEEPTGPGTNADTVSDCHTAPQGEVCDVYECNEDVQSSQSSCTLAFHCVDDPEYGSMCVEVP